MKANQGFMKRVLLFSAIILLFLNLFVPQISYAAAHDPDSEEYDYKLRFWEDNQPDIGFYINAAARYTLETVQAPNMGTTSGDWSVMNLLRGMYTGSDYMNDIPENYFEDYVERVEEYVVGREGNLDRNKSTEWSRLILALSSLDYDIKDVAGYDFIDRLSSSYQFSYRQGINGPIWEVIAMNTGGYNFYPDDSNDDVNTHSKMIEYILNDEIKTSEETVGGWALFGNIPDPDITGMALQALAPYYGDKALYEETGTDIPYEELLASVERAVFTLSEVQAENGAFRAFGTVNSESTAQVIVALTALGIDPLAENIELNTINKQTNFLTDGAEQDGVTTNNMVDGLLTFWADGSGSEAGVGGFKHVTTGFDGGGDAGTSVNGMATDQSLYALIAYDRFIKGEAPLYDMSDMMESRGGTPYRDQDVRELVVTYEGLDQTERKQIESYPYAIVDIIDGEASKGKEFISWNSEADGSGAVYEPEEKLSMPNQDITLFAQYENIEYTIRYETNGGTFIDDEITDTFTVDDEIILPTADAIENKDEQFSGWYDNADFEGEPVTSIPTGSYENQVYYAKWKEIDSEVNEEAIAAVDEMIHNLPVIEEVTLEDEPAVVEARTAYEKLNKEEQNLVTMNDELVALETKLSELAEEQMDQVAAQRVQKMIDDLPSVENVTIDHKEDTQTAQASYEALTEKQQQLVTNIEKITELESRISELEASFDHEQAELVAHMITDLPSEDDLIIDDKSAVEEVREAFYKLTIEQQALVENKDLFYALEAKMFEIEEIEADHIAVNQVESMINGLPDVSEVRLEDKETIQSVI